MKLVGFKWVCMFFLFVSIITLLPMEARAEKKIGILMFSEEPRYLESLKGIKEQLGKCGFREPAVKFTIGNAGGNKAKAAEMVQKFIAAKMNLIITIGTSATIAVTREIKDVPVVFSMVFDPVEAKIALDWMRSGNNTTGASSRISIKRLVSSLKEFTQVKRLAVLYTPSEKNSEAQLKELQRLQADAQIRVIPVPLTKEDEVIQILPEVIRTSDAMYLTGSSIVGKNVTVIVDMAAKAKVVTITHLEDFVENGVLLGVCADPYLVGRLAGEKAVKVLKGAKPTSIPIESLKKPDVIINMKTAKKGGFTIPQRAMKTATRIIE